MHFSLSRDTLLKPLQFIAGVVERRQTLPVLSNVLFSLKDSILSLTGTDTEVELITRIKLETEHEEGDITVPARKLMDICRSLPENANLKFSLEGDKLILSSGRSRFNLATLPAVDFPEVDSHLQGLMLNLPVSALKCLFDQTAFAMAQQDVRYFLNGTLLAVNKQMVTAVATDGHRLALHKYELSQPAEQDTNIIIPRKGVMEIQRVLADNSDAEAQLTIATNHIRVKVNDFTLTSKLIDGRYPDYQRVIPKQGDKQLLVDRDVLRSALSRVSVLSNEKFRGVRLELQNEQLRLVTNNPEREQAEDEIEVQYTGEPLQIGFNVNYLMDALAVLDAGAVKIQLSNANGSALIEQPETHPNSLYVVMPMRL